MLDGKAARPWLSSQQQVPVLQRNILHRILVQNELKAAAGDWKLFRRSKHGLFASRCNCLRQHRPLVFELSIGLRGFRRMKDKSIGGIQAKANAVSGMEHRGLDFLTVYKSSVGGAVL